MQERRKLKLNGKNQTITCAKCDFKATSKTLLNRHKKLIHEEPSKQEIRKRYCCEICNYKTTSETTLKLHMSTNHIKIKQNVTKRKSCELCDKKFNKENTFNQHMQKIHKININMTMPMEGQSPKEI